MSGYREKFLQSGVIGVLYKEDFALDLKNLVDFREEERQNIGNKLRGRKR